MRSQLRRWPMLALLAVLAGCGGGTQLPSTARTRATALPAELMKVTFDPSPWHTDFTRHNVTLSSILPGGPPPDGIPPIDHPRFVTAPTAARFLAAGEPVIAVVIAGHARAYPLQILVWHEIVNDTLAGRPIAVTYCPLCNSAIVFNRHAAGRVLTFGTTGNLRNSDLVMWDRQTQSWWQQFDGQAIVGTLTGTRLAALDSQTLSFAEFRARYPAGEVLSRDTGFQRPYGQSPYVGYDNRESSRPFDYSGRVDPRLPAVERVESITVGADTAVEPFDALRDHPVMMAAVDGIPVVVLFDPRVVSPLDEASIARSRAVGTAAAFDRRFRRRTFTFRAAGTGLMSDVQTGSTWDITGRAIAGPLAGNRLHRVRDLNAFWFAVAAFVPHARLLAVGSES